MKKCVCMVALVISLSVAGGCQKAVSDKEAIRGAIEKHLSDRGGLNMAAMEIDVQQVTIKGDDADALVEFRVKQGGGGMQVSYTLQRVQGAWVVGHSRPAGGNISHPPMDKASALLPPPGAAPASDVSPEFPAMDRFKNQAPAPGTAPLPPGHPPTAKPASVPL